MSRDYIIGDIVEPKMADVTLSPAIVNDHDKNSDDVNFNECVHLSSIFNYNNTNVDASTESNDTNYDSSKLIDDSDKNNDYKDSDEKEIIDDKVVTPLNKPSPRILTTSERQLKEETIYYAAVAEHEADQARLSTLTLSLKRNKAIFTASENKVIHIIIIINIIIIIICIMKVKNLEFELKTLENRNKKAGIASNKKGIESTRQLKQDVAQKALLLNEVIVIFTFIIITHHCYHH